MKLGVKKGGKTNINSFRKRRAINIAEELRFRSKSDTPVIRIVSGEVIIIRGLSMFVCTHPAGEPKKR